MRTSRLHTREGLHRVDTTRSFPRTLREAFPSDFPTSAIGIDGPVITPTRPTLVEQFLRLFKARSTH